MVFFSYCVFLFITLMMKARCGQLFTGKYVKIDEGICHCLHRPLGAGLISLTRTILSTRVGDEIIYFAFK